MARQEALLRTARLLTDDRHQAEDLVQTTLVRVWPRWSRLVAGGEDPEGYVRRVMVNSYLTWRRRRWWGEQPAAWVPDPPGAADRTAGTELRIALAGVLRQLPRAQRAVVVLRFYEDLSVGQTAALLGVTEGTVKSQTAKALHKLKAVVTVEELR